MSRKRVEHKYSGILSEESRFDDLLDIDKVIANHEANENTRAKPSRQRKSPNASSNSGEHPFDLSFLQSGINDIPDFSEDEGFQGPGSAAHTGKNGKFYDQGSMKEGDAVSPGPKSPALDEDADKDSVIGSDTSLQEKIVEAKNLK